MEKLKQQPKIDLALTTAVTSPSGNHLFAEGIILRKMSKFVLGSAEDGIIPLPVFYNPETGKILLDSIPVEIREDYKDISFTLEK